MDSEGTKILVGNHNGVPFGVVFAGDAGVSGAKSTLDFIKEAADDPASLQDTLGSSLRKACQEIEKHAYDEEDLAKMPSEMREAFFSPPEIFAFYSIRQNEWHITSARSSESFTDLQCTYEMKCTIPTQDSALRQELLNLRDNDPKCILDALPSCGLLFDEVARRLKDNCRYPGHVLLHTQAGIAQGTFNSPNELVVFGKKAMAQDAEAT